MIRLCAWVLRHSRLGCDLLGFLTLWQFCIAV